MNFEKNILQKEGSIVDVRRPEEFSGGHVSGSVNIPLQEIPNRLEELKQMPKPLILCCASGNRSGQARQYLTQSGIDCINGGSWQEVNFLTGKTKK